MLSVSLLGVEKVGQDEDEGEEMLVNSNSFSLGRKRWRFARCFFWKELK